MISKVVMQKVEPYELTKEDIELAMRGLGRVKLVSRAELLKIYPISPKSQRNRRFLKVLTKKSI